MIFKISFFAVVALYSSISWSCSGRFAFASYVYEGEEIALDNAARRALISRLYLAFREGNTFNHVKIEMFQHKGTGVQRIEAPIYKKRFEYLQELLKAQVPKSLIWYHVTNIDLPSLGENYWSVAPSLRKNFIQIEVNYLEPCDCRLWFPGEKRVECKP